MVDATDETFVYEGSVWNLTGRVAQKPIYHKRELNRKMGTMTIVEIKPAGTMVSDPMSYKWVDPRELFHVNELEDDDIDVAALKDNNDRLLGRKDD